MTLLLFPSLRVVATSMEFFHPPCHLFFLPVPRPCCYCYCLLKDYHYVASAYITQVKYKSFSITNVWHEITSQLKWFPVPAICLSCQSFHASNPLETPSESYPLHHYPLPLLLHDSTLYATAIKFTDLCVAYNNVAIPSLYTYSGSSIELQKFLLEF